MATRLGQLIRRAAVGLFTDASAEQAFGLLSGVYPSAIGATPQRGTKELLEGYTSMPWLRAVVGKVSQSVAATEWVLYAPERGRRVSRSLRRAERPVRQKAVRKQVTVGELVPVEDHLLLEALVNANDFLVGPALFRVTQVHLDLAGEAFWIKERNAVGAPVAFWPIPPHWVLETPTPKRRSYGVGFQGWRGQIPDTEIVWMVDPDPANPYARGSGIGRALADELETDEYASRHMKMTFLNRARPDMIIWPEEGKNDTGQIDESAARRLQQRWTQEHGGFWRAAKPFFATRKIGLKEVGQSFQDLQMIELRKSERDIITQTYGMPPEQLGIIESSNRATIDASDFLFKNNLVVPRLEFLRAYLQERVVPEYDENLLIDYVSPVSEDREFQLKTAQAASYALTVDEWRELQGFDPLPDGTGAVHVLPSTFVTTSTLDVVPTLTLASAGTAPVTRQAAVHPDQDAMRTAAVALREAKDVDAASIIERALADDPDDLPGVARRLVNQERTVTRAVFKQFQALRDDTPVEGIERLIAIGTPTRSQVLQEVPLERWGRDIESDTADWMAAGYLTGAKLAIEETGGKIRREWDADWMHINQAAVTWAAGNAGTMIVGLNTVTEQAIRAAITEALERGLGARDAARIVRQYVGLTDQQRRASNRFFARLLDDDVPMATILRRMERYTDAQRRVRALTIARTELMTAGNVGQRLTWEDAVRSGALDASRTRRKWLVAWDERLEPDCESLADTTAPLDGPFPDGTFEPPRHINCRCTTGLVFGDPSEFEEDAHAPAVTKAAASTTLREDLAQAIRAGFRPLADAVERVSAQRMME